MHRGQILFAYLHLAPEPALLDALLRSGVSGIAYETVTDASGGLPLLAPMSRIAGKLSIQFGAWALQMANGGSGVLLGGVPGVAPGKVVVIGAGAAGANAVRVAIGFGADVTVFDVNTATLAHLEELYQGRVKTCYSEPLTLAEHVAAADLVIGATLTPGKLAPRLISRELLSRCGRDRCWWTSRSTRAASPKPRAPLRIRTRPMSKKAWCTTACRTCPPRSRGPRRWR